MRKITLSLFAALSCGVTASYARTLPTPADCAFADTECVTNAPLDFISRDVNVFSATLSLTATPTNNVELLLAEEADHGYGDALSLGWDAGSWFLRNGSTQYDFAPRSDDARKSISIEIRVGADGRPTSLSVCESEESIDIPSDIEKKLLVFSRRWDTALVIRRGFGPTDEVPTVRFSTDPSSMMFR